MPPETKQEAPATPEVATEGGAEPESEFVKVPKADYDKLHETVGSLKRELKDTKKSKEEPKEPPSNPGGNDLLQEAFLTAVGITDDEEVELALQTAKKWDMPINKLVKDDDFKQKLDKHRTAKANATATSNIRGDKGGGSSAKETSAYYIAKGAPPTADQVPDRKLRAQIARDMMSAAKKGKTFYND